MTSKHMRDHRYELTIYDNMGDQITCSLWHNKRKALKYMRSITFKYSTWILIDLRIQTEVA